ncbi:hypothetical protein [Streptomyces sp. V2I9]|uniref:hypothetical protein n=1 Tax=Streptomyces sp. V2I9 TaxID=3042304 RepID=UPI002789B196|nr:hypothetical protein [Streptomyces sp. V2I9]MDQ0987599.1 hypothetical protein [Streptomyces sp. V2I9]
MKSAITMDDAEDAAKLIACGMRLRQRPAKDRAYRDLVVRYRTESDFQDLVERTARGLGLKVLGATEDIGVALAALPNSAFETKIEDYVRVARQRGEGERLLHGIIHLAIAALAFPRPDDLANDGYTGRVSAEAVDTAVRDTCDRLREKAAAAEASGDTPTDSPELEKVWTAYARRPEAALTKDGRLAMNSTKGMITRALNFLTEQGFLAVAGAGQDGWYRTTPRYQLQVRELAATSAFEELLALGVVPISSHGTLRTAPQNSADQTTDTATPGAADEGLFHV